MDKKEKVGLTPPTAVRLVVDIQNLSLGTVHHELVQIFNG